MRHRAFGFRTPSSLAWTPAVATSWASCFHTHRMMHLLLGSQRGPFKDQAAAPIPRPPPPCCRDETQRPCRPRPSVVRPRRALSPASPPHPSLCRSRCHGLLAVFLLSQDLSLCKDCVLPRYILHHGGSFHIVSALPLTLTTSRTRQLGSNPGSCSYFLEALGYIPLGLGLLSC